MPFSLRTFPVEHFVFLFAAAVKYAIVESIMVRGNCGVPSKNHPQVPSYRPLQCVVKQYTF